MTDIPPQPALGQVTRRGLTLAIGPHLTLGVRMLGAGVGPLFFVGPTGLWAARRARLYSLDVEGWRAAWPDFLDGDPTGAADYLQRAQRWDQAVQREAERHAAAQEEERKAIDAAGEKARRQQALTNTRAHAVLRSCVLRGGFATEPLSVGAVADLFFAEHELMLINPADSVTLVRMQYREMVMLAVAGPGAVTTGGGFIGGGFGLKGAMEGMAIAGVLNALTTRTTVTTVVEVQDRTRDFVWVSSSVTPAALETSLMPVRARLRQASGGGRPGSQDAPSSGERDAAQALTRLAALHRDGALTDEEFRLAKRQYLDQH